MNKTIKFLPLLAATAMVGCNDYDFGVTSDTFKQKEYAENFEKVFGNIDPNQDWNAAGRVTAKVNLAGISNEKCDVLIYNGNPISGGQLAAYYAIEDSKEFELDLPKSSKTAFVSIVDADGKTLINRHYDIVDGVLCIPANVTRAHTDDTPVVGNINTLRTVLQTDEAEVMLYYLEDDEHLKTRDQQIWTLEDMIAIVGEGGTYNITTGAGYQYSVKYDEGYFAEGKNNRDLYADKFVKDVIFTADGGEITISNEFGGTAYTNQFGYYYYWEGTSPEETLLNKKNAKKIVLMKQAEPQNNIIMQRKKNGYVDEELSDLGSTGVVGMALPWVVSRYYNGSADFDGSDKLIGSTYRLVYFDAEGKPDYNFPAGMKIGFFVKTLDTSYHDDPTDDGYKALEIDGSKFRYSDSELNLAYNWTYGTTAGVGDWQAVTYTLNTTTEVEEAGVKKTITTKTVVTGFEDGTDEDLNDILFFVKGVQVNEIPSIETNAVKQSWVIACEDLGGSFDWDFNDMVFSVSHTAGETKAYVTPLASGGTLPVSLYYNSTLLGGKEFHQLIKDGAPSSETINAHSRGTAGATIEVTVPANYTLSYSRGLTNMGNFYLKVTQEEGADDATASTNITAPQSGAVPQMILIPGSDWAWPTELMDIRKPYPLFAAFVSDPSIAWYETVVLDKTVGKGASNGIGTIISGGSGSGSGSDSGSGNNNSGNPSYFVTPIFNTIPNRTLAPNSQWGGWGTDNAYISFAAQDNGKGSTTAFGLRNHCTFSSSDPAIATAEFCDGTNLQYIVKSGSKTGTAIITVTHAEDKTLGYNASETTFMVYVLSEPELSANNITLGCNKTLTLVRGVHYHSLSNGDITLSVEGEAATVEGAQIKTGDVGSSTSVTVTITQAATSTYAGGTCTFTLTVDPAAKDPATISLTGGEKNVTIAASENSATFTINASDYLVGASTGAITFESSDPSVFTLSQEGDVLTLTRATRNDKVAYVKIVQAADADHDAGFVNYVKVTVEGLPTENVVGKTKEIACTQETTSSPEYWKISLDGLGTGNQAVNATISMSDGFYVNGYCTDTNGSNLTADQATSLSSSFMETAFDKGYFFVRTYNRTTEHPVVTITFNAE